MTVMQHWCGYNKVGSGRFYVMVTEVDMAKGVH